MSISQRIDLKQTQNLVMTPQLQQAIKMLQLTNTELSELIEQEIEHNPLLERDERDDSAAEEQQQERDQASADQDSDNIGESFDSQWDEDSSQKSESSEGLQDFDAGSSMAEIGAGGNTSFDRLENTWENALANRSTLRDHLNEQVHLNLEDEKDRAVAYQLIDRLDESGFLRETDEELLDKLGCSEQRLEDVLYEVRQFDPTGVFARDLPDCFAMQLEERGVMSPAYEVFLAHLDMLAEHNHKGLREKCGVDEDTLKSMIAELRSLNPKPIGDFDHFVVQTALPDVLMRRIPKSEGGGWRVVLNTDTLPRVLVNNEYYTTVANSAKSKEDKSYINDRMTSANWLVRAMDQRAQTILKVASTIIEKQYAFFLYGVEYLTPLTLREVAEEIDMHESTVSRVTTNKYIGTPRGIFELKYFFSSGVSSAGGSDVSASAVKAKIKNLIEAEKLPKDVLSDDKIADLLEKEEGIEVARRTVAKYREALGYGSSVQRRRILKNKS